jgi:hypothetical protein
MSIVTSLSKLARLAALLAAVAVLLALAGRAEGEVPAVDWAAVER